MRMAALPVPKHCLLMGLLLARLLCFMPGGWTFAAPSCAPLCSSACSMPKQLPTAVRTTCVRLTTVCREQDRRWRATDGCLHVDGISCCVVVRQDGILCSCKCRMRVPPSRTADGVDPDNVNGWEVRMPADSLDPSCQLAHKRPGT